MIHVEVLAIDPGSESSAWIEYTDGEIGNFAKTPNQELVDKIRRGTVGTSDTTLAIEMLKPRGMPTSWNEMITAVWIGRFIEAWEESNPRNKGESWKYIFRIDEKMHLCGRANAKDSNIRTAIADRYGGSPKVAKGTKNNPGPLYGISNDLWQALAIAITFSEKKTYD